MALSTPKTKSGLREIHLDPETMYELKQHRTRQGAEAAELKERWKPQTPEYANLVFTNETGGFLYPRNLDREWYALQEKTRAAYIQEAQTDEEKLVRQKQIEDGKVLTHIRFHDLRHMHVSLLNKAGIDARTIADRIGHSDPAFTLRRYAHIFEEQRKAVAILVNKLLLGDGEVPN